MPSPVTELAIILYFLPTNSAEDPSVIPAETETTALAVIPAKPVPAKAGSG